MKKYFLFLLLYCVIAQGRSMDAPPQQFSRWYYGFMHNVNQVEMYVYNFGPVAHSYYGGWDPGCWWPKGSEQSYIFGAGPWFGTVNMLEGDTFVTTGYSTYNGWTEFLPGTKDVPWDSEDAQVYYSPQNWPASQEIFYHAPQEVLSDQDSWAAYNDLDPEAHTPGDRGPIGIQVYQTCYAWDVGGFENCIFLKYEVRNVTDSSFTNCYFGYIVDGDIGQEGWYSGNDITAGIVNRYYQVAGRTMLIDNLVYQWQEEQEPGWDIVPGVFGMDLLQSPWDLEEGHDKDYDGIPDQYERDSSYFYSFIPEEMWDADYDGLPDWRDPSQIPQLEMTAMKSYEPNTIPDNDIERFMILAGYNHINGAYEPYDTAETFPRDQRYIMCTGPFELMAESTHVFTFAVMFAEWYNIYARPDTAIVIQDHFCQLVYDQNWLLPKAPSPPHLTCIPGDASVTLVWDSSPEHESDPYYSLVGTNPNSPVYDQFYREHDFEGYRIWKSFTAEEGEWFKLEEYDLYNGIFFEDTSAIPGDTLIADDSGLRHLYIDQDVRNGFTYYYAVSSFDQNYTKTSDSTFKVLRMESKPLLVPAAPRRDPANYVPGTFMLEQPNGNDRLLDQVSVAITYPLDMTFALQHLVFGDIDWAWYHTYDSNQVVIDSIIAPEVCAYITGDSYTPVDSARIVFQPQTTVDFNHMFGTLHGLNTTVRFVRDSFPVDESLFDSVACYGSYPDTLVFPVPPGSFAPYWTFWGYRGNRFSFDWVTAPGGGLTLQVLDMHTNTVIPYKPYFPNSSHQYDTLAHGWCFLSLRQVSDTLIMNGQNPQTLWNTRYIHICGGLIAVKGGGPLMPSDPLPQPGDRGIVYARDDFSPMAVNAEFNIVPTPAYFDSVTQIIPLNVKVVPNPYIVHHEWQYSFEYRRVKFINLPAECTLRIFTLAGELIRVIKHHHTTGSGVVNDAGGDEWWDMLSDTRNRVVSGVYIFHVQSDVGEQTGKFVIIR